MLHLGVHFPNDPNYWQDQFVDTLVSPEEWRKVADNILCTLDLLRDNVIVTYKSYIAEDKSKLPQLRVAGIYMMSSAYFFENLFKALIIEQGPFTPKDFAKRLPDKINTHDLISLANSMAKPINLSDEGHDLLVRLTAYAYWAGRYPAPISARHLKPVQLTETTSGITRTLRGSDLRNIEILTRELYRLSDRKLPAERCATEFPDVRQQWEGLVIAGPIKPVPV